ncbi:MAG: ATPase V [Bacteroidales bacterium]|nr:ATPase V [Bacteroidales bacterium]
MIERMTRYDFILLSQEQDVFLEHLKTLGVMDITRSSKPVDEHSEELLSSIESIRAEIKRIQKGSDARLKALESELEELKRQNEELAHWGEFDPSKLNSLGVGVKFYCLPEKIFKPEWTEQYALQETDRHKGKIWFVVFGGDDFPAVPVPAPELSISGNEVLIGKKEAEIAEYKAGLVSLRDTLPSLEEKERALREELDTYLAKACGESAADHSLTVFEGFAPSTESERLAKDFNSLDCVWFSAEATVEDNPPIKLKNNKFVKQFETLTDMYGRPDYNEFDPTPYISIFFLLFFAMCMGDAGYGLLLIIGGILLKKVESMKNLAPLVTILGVGTFVVGIVMHTFFGVDISALPWIPSWLKSVMITGNIAGFDAQMVLSLVIGVIHLSLAMIVKTVYATKNKGFLGSLGVWGWTLLIVGGVIVGTLAIFSLLPPAVTKWIIIGLGIVSALGIFLFNDIHRNPLKNIGSGLWETYNTVTGLLGDVLSYLRLYALGLAGGMLGKAFNDIASMTLGDGSFGIGWLAFVIILIIGHALNLAMCCLGAFVHPLRLNFLEFFKNSGYDGKGRAYQPIKK